MNSLLSSAINPFTSSAFRAGSLMSANKDNSSCLGCRQNVNIAAIRYDRAHGFTINDVVQINSAMHQQSQRQKFRIPIGTKRTKKKDIIALLAVQGTFTKAITISLPTGTSTRIYSGSFWQARNIFSSKQRFSVLSVFGTSRKLLLKNFGTFFPGSRLQSSSYQILAL